MHKLSGSGEKRRTGNRAVHLGRSILSTRFLLSHTQAFNITAIEASFFRYAGITS